MSNVVALASATLGPPAGGLPSRDLVLCIAAVAWWTADPIRMIPMGVPPDEYSAYAIEFTDRYRAGMPILPLVVEINAIFEGKCDEKTSRKIAELINFGLYQYGYDAPDHAELDQRENV